MTDVIALDIEEANELLFKVKIEGNIDNTPAKVRMICEGEDVSFMFPGRPIKEEQDIVQFLVPKMDKSVKPGMYSARVEVMVENRYFIPVEFDVEFKKTLSVVAEAVKIEGPQPKVINKLGGITVSAGSLPVNMTTIKREQEAEKTNSTHMSEQKEKTISKDKRIIDEVSKKLSSDDLADDETIRKIARSILQKKLRK